MHQLREDCEPMNSIAAIVNLSTVIPRFRRSAMIARLSLLVAFVFAVPVFADEPPAKLAPYFKPPAEFAKDFGGYRSPLKFDDGTDVKTADDWTKRRAEIRKYWHG